VLHSGLGAALEIDTIMNSELRDIWGGSKITVVEQTKPLSTYDPTKGFMYLVSELGLKFTDRHGLSEIIAAEGVDGSTLNGNRIGIDGSRSRFSFSFGDIRKPYWLPRHGLLAILEKAVRGRAAVDLKEGWQVQELRRVAEGENTLVEALLVGPGGEQKTMRPFLVVGADGLKSVVRSSLAEWAAQDGQDADRFEMQEKPSPAGGLRYKVLKLKGSFALPDEPSGGARASGAGSAPAMIEPEKSYSFLSRYQGSFKHKNKETRLGLLPLKADYGYRTANIITWPDHDIWTNKSLSTPEGMQDFLHDSFPQVPWQDAVTQEELQRFAQSPGGRFPLPQTTKGGAVWQCSGVGVALVGDSLHAFPPDLGQGVNSALKDVATLGDALRNASSSAQSEGFELGPRRAGRRLAAALQSYEAEATGEAKALVRLMQLGSPYQYSQPGFRAQVAAKLMAANLIIRLVFSKIPVLGNSVFYPQISMLTQLSGGLSYREMLARAHRTSFAFGAIAIAAAMSVAKACLGGLSYTAGYWAVIAMWVCVFKALGF